ncbi:MAG: hypothetical protein IJP07_01010 [Firmicutes bacterium]|nr:hypothetical protein [Bacillota bacterium]
MPALNAVMFYKVKFTISSRDPKNDLLWSIVRHLKNWQTRKWNKNGYCVLPTQNQEWTKLKNTNYKMEAGDRCTFLESENFTHPEEIWTRYWACRITESPASIRGYAPRQWITEIGFEQTEENQAVFSCVVFYKDRAGFIGPYQDMPIATIPRLIVNIIQDPGLICFCGADHILEYPQKLEAGDWPSFRAKIESPNRQIPYIYVSPYITDYETQNTGFLIDLKQLAKTVFGNALVYYSQGMAFSKEMRDQNPEYACYGGAVRVYQPNAANSESHRFLSAPDIRKYGPDNVILFLRRAFGQNVNFYDTFFRIEDCKKKKTEYFHEKRLCRMQEEHQKHISEIEEKKLDDAIKIEEDLLAEKSYVDMLQKENEELRSTISNMSWNCNRGREAQEENDRLRACLQALNEVQEYPDSIKLVIQYFAKTFEDKIAFSSEALKSAKDCKIPLSELWKFLYNLAVIMKDLYEETGSGDIYKTFSEQTGITLGRGEGPGTRKDNVLMRQYEIVFEGEAINIETHIKYPQKDQSIHFGYSQRQKRIIVGHCGDHLDNYSTRKVK